MKAISLLLNVLGGAGLFVGAGAGWLAFTGRLTPQLLTRVPGQGDVENAAEQDHGDPDSLSKSGEKTTPTVTTESGQEPESASQDAPHVEKPKGAGGTTPAEKTPAPPKKPPADKTAASSAHPPPAAAVPVLPESFSVTEVNEMLRSSSKARTDYESRAAALDERERELERAAKDLDERRREIEGIMARLSEGESALAADRAKFEKDVVRVKESEIANLKKLAGLYEGMPDVAAATALAEIDVATAAKILQAMQKRKAGKVLGAMPAQLAAEVSDKMTRLLDEIPPPSGAGAERKK